MNYYENQKKEKAKKYRTNIKQNNHNYSITLFVVEEKLQISIKYSNPFSDEIFEYTNFYSSHQLKIINKYFRSFENTEKICKDLDRLLKKNKVSIDDKNGFLILSIQVLMKKEKTNIIFKLKKKVTDYRRNNDRSNNYNYNNINNYNKERNKNSISMPKYNNEDDDNKLKYLLNDLNDRVSMLENSHRYDSAPKEKNDYRYRNNSNNMNINESNLLIGNINNIMVRMNRLEDLNKEKDDRIKELEDKISKYENNLSNTMSYPTYSLPNKSQKSKNEKNGSPKKRKDSNPKDGEYEYEVNPDSNNNSIHKSKDKNGQKLRSKKKIEKEKPEYRFKKIEESKDQAEENNIKSSKRKNNTDNSKDDNSSRPKKNNIKSKSQIKNRKSQNSNSSEDDENKKNRRKKRNSYSSQKESEKSSTKDKKKNNKKRKEEERKSEDDEDNDEKNNKHEKETEKNSEKEEKNNKKRRKSDNSNSSEEKNNKKIKDNNSSDEEKAKKRNLNKSHEDIQLAMAKTGLPMVEREDLKNYINSRIFFTTKELQFIKYTITRNKEHLHCYFEVLYRASIDGDYEDNINNYCEGRYPQLILIYTSEGARFGAYIEKEKHTSFFGTESYREIPGTCFLFSLNSLKSYDIKEGKKATDDRPEKLCFGRSFLLNDNGSNWFIFTPRNAFLGAKCMIGDKESTFGNIDTSEIVGNKKEYTIKEVEIFKVETFTDDDEDDDEENTKFIKEKEIRVKNFSKKKRNNEDTIKIKNTKIQNEDNEED